jgi:hypothetical protein
MTLVAVYDGKRFGYADERGEIVIAPRFTKIPSWGDERFREGRVAAWDRKKWGLIGEDGAWIVEPRWDGAGGFREGRACVANAVKKRWRWRFAGVDGNEVGPEAGWFKLSALADGRAFAEDEPGSGTYLIDRDGNRVGSAMFAGSNGEADVGVRAWPFSEGLAAVQDAAGGAWGFVDRDGAWVVGPRYAAAASFSEGLACVRTADNDVLFVDPSGAECFRCPRKYLALSSFSEGLALLPSAEDSLAKVYVDRDGQVRIPARREHWGSFRDGRALYRLQSGACGFIDAGGQVVIEPTFMNAQDFRDGLALVTPDGRKPGRFGYIDRDGTMVIPPA